MLSDFLGDGRRDILPPKNGTYKGGVYKALRLLKIQVNRQNALL